MSLFLQQTTSFKRSLKKYKHDKKLLRILEEITELLVNEKTIPREYLDHPLSGKYKGVRELHLRPDDLLLYVKVEGKRITLVALGSHSEVF
jgi:mRNA interferase YafQ